MLFSIFWHVFVFCIIFRSVQLGLGPDFDNIKKVFTPTELHAFKQGTIQDILTSTFMTAFLVGNNLNFKSFESILSYFVRHSSMKKYELFQMCRK